MNRRSNVWVQITAALIVPCLVATLVVLAGEYLTSHWLLSIALLLSPFAGLPFAYKAAGRRAPWLAVLYVPIMAALVLGYLLWLGVLFNRFEL